MSNMPLFSNLSSPKPFTADYKEHQVFPVLVLSIIISKVISKYTYLCMCCMHIYSCILYSCYIGRHINIRVILIINFKVFNGDTDEMPIFLFIPTLKCIFSKEKTKNSCVCVHKCEYVQESVLSLYQICKIQIIKHSSIYV